MGNKDIVRILLESGANPDETDNYRRASLHWACYSDQVAIVDLLIKGGANINSLDIAGITPIFMATNNDNVELLQYLIDNGANPNQISGEEGIPPLFYAIKGNKINIVSFSK